MISLSPLLSPNIPHSILPTRFHHLRNSSSPDSYDGPPPSTTRFPFRATISFLFPFYFQLFSELLLCRRCPLIRSFSIAILFYHPLFFFSNPNDATSILQIPPSFFFVAHAPEPTPPFHEARLFSFLKLPSSFPPSSLQL